MSAVLDASALLAVNLQEAGAEIIHDVAKGARLSSVNYAEIVSKLIDKGYTDDDAFLAVSGLGCSIVPFDEELAFRAGQLRRTTRKFGLSLGDRACLALAIRERLPVFTADRRWTDLDLGVEIRVIR